MSTQFTTLEIQLIRSSLATEEDQEIAELLERPVEDIQEKINEITGGGAIERNGRILEVKSVLQREQKAKADLKSKKEAGRQKRLKASKERHSIKSQREEKEQERRNTIEFQEHQYKKKRKEIEIKQAYKTREVDWTKMKSVRVSRNTYVVVAKEMKDEDAIAQYYHNRDNMQRSAAAQELHEKMKPINHQKKDI